MPVFGALEDLDVGVVAGEHQVRRVWAEGGDATHGMPAGHEVLAYSEDAAGEYVCELWVCGFGEHLDDGNEVVWSNASGTCYGELDVCSPNFES